ncbi:ribonuclease K3-like [Mustela lutreola]|uniref:ribonuclease K3-like n=1 Tax=Mustela lutreola TaxID=9666 RepID=UPI0027977988|nr:ribonuclease K3-like [Mustela lutreola]XP_059037003.1 ribonuclease K3-like [Mustela lutreola]XP_059037004.1 ribonuclease K3-like [Mustela lutreola]XP_059037005.1 ribonuclease K3-like [Mustela lutreola]
MMLDLLGPFPLLLLLLGSWGPVHPLGAWAQPPTRAQWFAIQHISTGPVQCNMAMRRVNNYNQRCKPQNTFLHDTFQNVAATCLLPNRTCKNGQNNCHQSANRIGMTYCSHTGGTYPNCRYSTTPQNQFYTVACNPPQPGDPPYPLVPVHLD